MFINKNFRVLGCIFMLALCARTGVCWEAEACKAGKRIDKISQIAKKSKDTGSGTSMSGLNIEDVLALAKQHKRPVWINKSSWIEACGKKEYVFGVGQSQPLSSPRMQVRLAEMHALGELTKVAGSGEQTVEEHPGKKSINSSHTAALKNPRAIDWYLDETEKIMYVLTVVVR